MTMDPNESHSLQYVADRCHTLAKLKGWHDPPPTVAQMTMNLVGEVAELWESFRRGTLDAFCDKFEQGCPLTSAEEELADIIIRAFDTAGALGINIEKAIILKHNFNTTRPQRHGGKLA